MCEIHPSSDEVSRKKTPLLQLTDRVNERSQKNLSTGSRKHAVPQSTHYPCSARCKQRAGFKGYFINSHQ